MSAVESGEWNFFQCRMNDKPASVFLDMSAHQHQAGLPEMLIILLQLKMPHPMHGMTTDAEYQTLLQLEDHLIPYVTRTTEARYVGRITTYGWRQFYLYAPKERHVDLMPTLANFPGYEIEVQWHHDPEWKQYRDVLYPGEEDRQCMKNQDVLATLKKHGDALTAARPVTHWSYFAKEATRDAFLDQVKAEGYHVVCAEVIDPKHGQDGRRYSAVYEREDRVDYASTDQATISLFRLTKRYGGDYDGWETQVVK